MFYNISCFPLSRRYLFDAYEIMDALKDRVDVNSVTVFNPEGTEIQYLKKGNNYNEDNRY